MDKKISASLEMKVRQWQLLQNMVISIEGRTYGSLSTSVLVAAAGVMITGFSNKALSANFEQYIYMAIPAIILICTYFASHTTKKSAILRGYLMGLEDSINTELGEKVYVWNKPFLVLFDIKNYPSNGVLGQVFYMTLIAYGSIYSFIQMYLLYFGTSILYLFVIPYTIFFLFFMLMFAWESSTCGKTENRAHELYLSLNANMEDGLKNDKKIIDVINETLKNTNTL